MTVTDLLWPICDGPEDLERIEEIPLTERGLPQSTYALVARAAEMWPDAPAVSFFPEAERWEEVSTRTFAHLASDQHRAADVLSDLRVGRGDAVAVVSVNCEQMVTTLLVAEAVGIAAPINPGLSPEHAAQLVDLAGVHVIVAAGPELDPASWELARQLARQTGARALLAWRPVLPRTAPVELEALDGVAVAYLETLAVSANSDGCGRAAGRL